MRKKKSKKILFHLYLFIFGSLYYWILPIISLKSHIIDGMPGVHLLYNYNFESYLEKYFLIIAIFDLSFIIGALLPLYFKNQTKSKQNEKFVSPRDIALLSIPFFIIGQLTIIKARNSLFLGYTGGYNIEVLGTIATVNCIFLILYLITKEITINNEKRKHELIVKYMLFSIAEFSIVLLGFGSRMYVMIPIIAISIFYLRKYKINRRMLYGAGIVIILFLGVGVWRLSLGRNLDSSLLIYIGCAEPLFTWISAISYFEYNQIPIISIPYNFISSFVNFIPTFFLSQKSEYIYSVTGFYDSPLGATSLLTSLLGNFGVLGGAVVLFVTGCILTVILYNWQSYFGKAYYCCICGVIPFQFFRDGFNIVNKMVCYNFLILPLIIIGFIKYINSNCENNRL